MTRIEFMNINEHDEHVFGVLRQFGKKFIFSLSGSAFGRVLCSFFFIMFIKLDMRSVGASIHPVFMNIMNFYEHGLYKAILEMSLFLAVVL